MRRVTDGASVFSRPSERRSRGPPPSAVPRRTRSQRSLNLMGPLVNPASASASARNYELRKRLRASGRACNGRAHFYDGKPGSNPEGRRGTGGRGIQRDESNEARAGRGRHRATIFQARRHRGDAINLLTSFPDVTSSASIALCRSARRSRETEFRARAARGISLIPKNEAE